ncbi:hypothetical protein Tco_0324161 [Tanacetum coccineum]
MLTTALRVVVKQIIFITIQPMNDFDWMIIPKKVETIPELVNTQLILDYDWLNFIFTNNCNKIKLGNGDKTVFWEDIWIDGKTLKNRFPRIYSLESCKLITVGAKLAQPSLEYSFRRNPRGGVEQDQFNELSVLVHDVSLIPMSDRWKWDLESSGDFSVASVRKIIDDKSLSDVDSKTRWIKYVPIKVNVHARGLMFHAEVLILIPLCMLFVIMGWRRLDTCSSIVAWLDKLFASFVLFAN